MSDSNRLEMKIGDAQAFTFTVTQDGAAFPGGIANWTFEFAAVSQVIDPPPKSFTVPDADFEILDPNLCTVKLVIPSATTRALNLTASATYVFSLRGTDGDGEPHTLDAGQLALVLTADEVVQ